MSMPPTVRGANSPPRFCVPPSREFGSVVRRIIAPCGGRWSCRLDLWRWHWTFGVPEGDPRSRYQQQQYRDAAAFDQRRLRLHLHGQAESIFVRLAQMPTDVLHPDPRMAGVAPTHREKKSIFISLT